MYSVNHNAICGVLGVRCPFCSNNETKVVETRETGEEITRRRRECLSCEKRFTTYERFENNILRVIKKDGNRESFDKEKLRKGVLRACEKRPITTDEINNLVDDMEKSLLNKYMPEVKASVIGRLLMTKLKKLDPVAYIRFASVYKEFKDLEDFEEAVKELLTRQKQQNNNNK